MQQERFCNIFIFNLTTAKALQCVSVMLGVVFAVIIVHDCFRTRPPTSERREKKSKRTTRVRKVGEYFLKKNHVTALHASNVWHLFYC